MNMLLGARTAIAVAVDEFFNLTTLLLPGNGTNGAQNNTFLDSSTNNFTITRNGNTTQGTFSPFSQTGWSNYLAGGSDNFTAPSNAALGFGTGDFTIEFWSYLSSASTTQVLFDNRNAGTGIVIYSNSGTLTVNFNNSGGVLITGTALTSNQWQHIALTRASGTSRLYLNGTQVGSSAADTNNYPTNVTYIGSSFTPSQNITGYISNLRVVKGTAVYTSNFTPPTAPLTAITNTSLLTCQSNRFVDNSSNAFALTVTGTPSVQAFTPFLPTIPYSAATVGGSGYFDGSGDFLTVPSTSALSMGTGDFCLEMWIYPTAPSGDQCLYANFASGGGNTQMGLFIRSGNSLRFSSWDTAFLDSAGGTIVANAWHHIVVCRSGNNGALFINRVRQATSSGSPNNFSSTDSFSIGRRPANDQFFPGYICGLRSVKGSSVYDPTQTTLTLPTAPPTAITNTSLLTNFTNAGIIDATSDNVLETVGNAQISTTQSKFGGSSMSFDGTGDYLTTKSPTADLFAFGSGDFTIEMWVRFGALPSAGNYNVFYDSRPFGGATSTNPMISLKGSTIVYFANAADRITSGTVSTGQWYHLAVSRSGTSTRMFLDGTQAGSTYTDSTVYTNTANRPYIGGDSSQDASSFNGFIDDLRVTKGFARYTANFTAPTTAFPLQ
jgi:hypothetical protein